jgi:hypothetical protein
LFFHASVFASWLFLYIHRLVLTWWLGVRMWWLAPFTPQNGGFSLVLVRNHLFFEIFWLFWRGGYHLPALVPL